MAKLIRSDRPKFTLNSADTYILGHDDDGMAGMWAVHLVSSSFSGSITVKGRSSNKEANSDAGNDDIAFAAIPYINLHLNGSAGDGNFASTPITNTSIILIPAHVQEVALDCTSFTSGSMAVYHKPFEGAA